MRYLALFIVTILVSGCAQYEQRPDYIRSSLSYSGGMFPPDLRDSMEANDRRIEEEYRKKGKKIVSDDTIIIQHYDQNGQKIGTSVGH